MKGRVFFIASFIALALAIGPARAQTCTTTTEENPYKCLWSMDIEKWWLNQDFTTNQKAFIAGGLYSNYFVKDFWANNLEPTLLGMTGQFYSSTAQNTGILGTMMDGQAMNETVLALQTLEAQAYRDYTPGETLCRFGTNVRSLGASDFRATTTLALLDEMAEDRMLHKKGGITGGSSAGDRLARFNQFQRLYCNPGDNNGSMKNICYPTTKDPTSVPARMNRDIDITRTLWAPRTLNINFTDGDLSNDEQDILALSSNLYSHDLFDAVPPGLFTDSPGDPNRAAYLDVRQIVALRGMAQHSFNAVVASKARGQVPDATDSTGAGGVQPFMTAALQEMGMSVEEASRYLDNGTKAPSYDAQMEVLTKTLYQNPNFYVHLVDKPANVKRTLAAMEAIDLAQTRDTFESLERQELLLSLLLELEIRAEQQRIENDVIGGRGQ